MVGRSERSVAFPLEQNVRHRDSGSAGDELRTLMSLDVKNPPKTHLDHLIEQYVEFLSRFGGIRKKLLFLGFHLCHGGTEFCEQDEGEDAEME